MAKQKTKKKAAVEESAVEQPVSEQTKTAESPELDSKTKVLLQFKALMEGTIKSRSKTSTENGIKILNLYNAYTGRQERWTGCTSCVSGKYQYLMNECEKKGIKIEL